MLTCNYDSDGGDDNDYDDGDDDEVDVDDVDDDGEEKALFLEASASIGHFRSLTDCLEYQPARDDDGDDAHDDDDGDDDGDDDKV